MKKYENLSYKDKFKRTIWGMGIIIILCIVFLPNDISIKGMSKYHFILIALILTVIQVVYNYNQWKKSSNELEQSGDWDLVRDDLLKYSQNLSTLSKLANEASNFKDMINYEDGINDQEFIVLETMFKPKYWEFIKGIENIESPTTAEVKELHLLYKESQNDQYNSLIEYLEATKAQDANLIEEAGLKINEARQKFDLFESGIRKLAEKYNLDIDF